MFIDHLYILFYVGFIQIFGLLLNGVDYLIQLKTSLNILDTNPLSNIRIANIFAHFVSFLFILLILCFKGQNFKVLMGSC